MSTAAATETLLGDYTSSGRLFSGGWIDAPLTIDVTEPATGESLGAGAVDRARVRLRPVESRDRDHAVARPSGAERVEQLRAGMVHVNDQTVNEEAPAPFGGFGATGQGFCGGSANLEAFTRWQWLTSRDSALPFPF